jgi:hypothetical protein
MPIDLRVCRPSHPEQGVSRAGDLELGNACRLQPFPEMLAIFLLRTMWSKVGETTIPHRQRAQARPQLSTAAAVHATPPPMLMPTTAMRFASMVGIVSKKEAAWRTSTTQSQSGPSPTAHTSIKKAIKKLQAVTCQCIGRCGHRPPYPRAVG